ncbi:MAG: TetR/AcrR family transcriptional regulator [Blautia sp.]|nr:TetR/AcrR family transcriptional regulator [Blautia sp.]
MDKRKEANRIVKEAITDALFSLMRKKSFYKITITEISRLAGVARASFYRNYSSKEDVLQTLVDEVLEKFRSETLTEPDDFYCYENVLRSFRYFYEYRQYFVDMCRADFASLLLASLNQFHESIAGVMPANSIDRYQLYMYMGALINTAIVWLWEEPKESVEDMAHMFCRQFGITT